MALETDIQKLIEKVERPDHLEEVKLMQKTLKTAMLKKNFKEHPAVQLMLSTLRKREEAYTIILANKEDLTEGDRKKYFGKRQEVRWILSFFDVDKTIQSIEERVAYQLSDEVEGGDSEGDV